MDKKFERVVWHITREEILSINPKLSRISMEVLKRAIINTKNTYHKFSKEFCLERLKVLDEAFIFDSTPEGSDYWWGVCRDLAQDRIVTVSDVNDIEVIFYRDTETEKIYILGIELREYVMSRGAVPEEYSHLSMKTIGEYLYEQYNQGVRFNLPFDVMAGEDLGGMVWSKTKEGFEYWKRKLENKEPEDRDTYFDSPVSVIYNVDIFQAVDYYINTNKEKVKKKEVKKKGLIFIEGTHKLEDLLKKKDISRIFFKSLEYANILSRNLKKLGYRDESTMDLNSIAFKSGSYVAIDPVYKTFAYFDLEELVPDIRFYKVENIIFPGPKSHIFDEDYDPLEKLKKKSKKESIFKKFLEQDTTF